MPALRKLTLMWFKRKRILPDQAFMDWSFEVWQWILESSGGFGRYNASTSIVLPDLQYFPLKHQETHKWAVGTFDNVKSFMGMNDWPCRFYEDNNNSMMDELLGNGVITSFTDAAGTFGYDENGAIITYNKSILADSTKYIATMSHELSHYFLANFYHQVPGGKNVEEHATDLCAILKGFGVFFMNSYFSSSGFFSSSQGYLNEIQIAFNTAIFCSLKGLDPVLLKKHIKKSQFKYLMDAYEEINEKYNLKVTWLASV